MKATVVTVTVFIVVIIGTFAGAVLPLAFKRSGMDPALMSTPLIAALADVGGAATYYLVAIYLLDIVVVQ